MIELNLLPQELRKKRKKIELPEIPIIPIAASVIVALILIQLLLTVLIFTSKAQLNSAEKTWTELGPKKAEFDKIKNEIALGNQKIKAIDQLIADRLSWSHLLNRLSDSLMSNVWLTEFSYNEKKAAPVVKKSKKRKKKTVTPTISEETLTLSGSASGRGEESTAYIARFIRALKNNQEFFRNFDDIELVSIKQGTVSGQSVMNFKIVCKFKKEG